jgi:hypothetical protein
MVYDNEDENMHKSETAKLNASPCVIEDCDKRNNAGCCRLMYDREKAHLQNFYKKYIFGPDLNFQPHHTMRHRIKNILLHSHIFHGSVIFLIVYVFYQRLKNSQNNV